MHIKVEQNPLGASATKPSHFTSTGTLSQKIVQKFKESITQRFCRTKNWLPQISPQTIINMQGLGTSLAVRWLRQGTFPKAAWYGQKKTQGLECCFNKPSLDSSEQKRQVRGQYWDSGPLQGAVPGWALNNRKCFHIGLLSPSLPWWPASASTF